MRKTPAQLDRDIAESLARPAVTPKMQAALAGELTAAGRAYVGGGS